MNDSASEGEILEHVISQAKPVLDIEKIDDQKIWYRKPEGGRRGPWFSAKFIVSDNERWNKKQACIYFLVDGSSELKYVGISVNRLKDRWRLSPAFDSKIQPLGEEELFHSQCWSYMCDEKYRLKKYKLLSLYDFELIQILKDVKHEISALSIFSSDPEIAIIAFEVWIIKHFMNYIWNKRK
jgi:hypothetical protein